MAGKERKFAPCRGGAGPTLGLSWTVFTRHDSSLAAGIFTKYKHTMPTVHRELGFVFYFYSDEGNEPAHVHVEKGDGTAKDWINPLRLANAEGLKVKEIRHILRIAERNQAKLLEKWDEFSKRKS